MLTTVDRFPLDVTIGDVTHRGVRLVVVPDGPARLFGVVEGQPVLIASAVTEGAVDGRRMVVEVHTADGEPDWQVAGSPGCGCGSPLKRTAREQLLALAAQ